VVGVEMPAQRGELVVRQREAVEAAPQPLAERRGRQWAVDVEDDVEVAEASDAI